MFDGAAGINGGTNAGRVCWALAGTLCGGRVNGDFARKLGTCLECDVYRRVREEEGDAFRHGAEILLSHRDPGVVEHTLEHLYANYQKLKTTQDELTQCAGLRAIAQLAAGIAHEINSPLQFVGDHLTLAREALEWLAGQLERAHSDTGHGDIDDGRLSHALADLDSAIAVADQGMRRIAVIVRSLKELARRGHMQMGPEDLNRVVTNALLIAHAEYKRNVDVQTDFGTLPEVVCHAGALGQAVLNVIVNAAQAVCERVKSTGRRGLIILRTWHEHSEVCVSVIDDGVGIPEPLRERLFASPLGAAEGGTGRGLALARSWIVDHHGGSISLDSTTAHGTAVTIRIPIAGRPPQVPAMT